MSKSREEKIKDIKQELNDIYSFMSADENQGYSFSQSLAEERAEYLEKLLAKLLKEEESK